jgi:hypothetical protein
MRVNEFLGAFAILRKAPVSFVMSAHPSVLMHQLGSHRTDIHEIWYLSIFRVSVEEIEVSLKFEYDNAYFT